MVIYKILSISWILSRCSGIFSVIGCRDFLILTAIYRFFADCCAKCPLTWGTLYNLESCVIIASKFVKIIKNLVLIEIFTTIIEFLHIIIQGVIMSTPMKNLI